MNRRDALKITAAVATAGPGLAQTQSWKPQTFDAHQNETVVALSELIIPATDTPGAKAAQVNRYIDLLLHDGPATERERFLDGLSFLDGYSIRKHGNPFVKLNSPQQTAILEVFDGGTELGVMPGNRFFRQAKQWTSRVYYATQAGFTELNKGGRVPAKYGCVHGAHAI
jgi:hypothetical protein